MSKFTPFLCQVKALEPCSPILFLQFPATSHLNVFWALMHPFRLGVCFYRAFIRRIRCVESRENTNLCTAAILRGPGLGRCCITAPAVTLQRASCRVAFWNVEWLYQICHINTGSEDLNYDRWHCISLPPRWSFTSVSSASSGYIKDTIQ